TATTSHYTLPLHDALPISRRCARPTRLLRWHGRWRTSVMISSRQADVRTGRASVLPAAAAVALLASVATSLVIGTGGIGYGDLRSEEHTSELQSREKLVCR